MAFCSSMNDGNMDGRVINPMLYHLIQPHYWAERKSPVWKTAGWPNTKQKRPRQPMIATRSICAVCKLLFALPDWPMKAKKLHRICVCSVCLVSATGEIGQLHMPIGRWRDLMVTLRSEIRKQIHNLHHLLQISLSMHYYLIRSILKVRWLHIHPLYSILNGQVCIL